SDRNREVLGLKRTGIEVDALVKSQLELDTAMESISLSMKRLDKLDQSIDAISTMSEYQAAREEVERVYISCRACTYVASRCSGIYSALSSDMLQLCSNEREQVQICQKALKMMSETLLASKQCLDYAGSLTWQIRMGTEAKFRLFVNPVDVDALSMLRNVKAELMKYFPPDDEMIVSLDQSLQSYSWSRIFWTPFAFYFTLALFESDLTSIYTLAYLERLHSGSHIYFALLRKESKATDRVESPARQTPRTRANQSSTGRRICEGGRGPTVAQPPAVVVVVAAAKPKASLPLSCGEKYNGEDFARDEDAVYVLRYEGKCIMPDGNTWTTYAAAASGALREEMKGVKYADIVKGMKLCTTMLIMWDRGVL
ncbi:hypothetical protein THAOC_35957, partial [Thalassiosira oceanica]